MACTHELLINGVPYLSATEAGCQARAKLVARPGDAVVVRPRSHRYRVVWRGGSATVAGTADARRIVNAKRAQGVAARYLPL